MSEILDLPANKFTANVQPEFLNDLIERAIHTAGGSGKLSDFLIRKYGIKKYDKRELVDCLRKWQRKKRQIFLDCYFAIGEFIGVEYAEICRNIKEIRLEKCRKGLHIGYPLKLNGDWIFVSECVRVEGTMTRKRIVLENTNMEIISAFRDSIRKLGVPEKNFKELLHIRIQIPENVPKNKVKIVNFDTKEEIKNSHQRILKLKKGAKKEVTFSEMNFTCGNPLRYKIKLPHSSFSLKVKIINNEKIFCASTLKDKRYQRTCVSLRLDVHNKTLVWLLNKIFNIPIGNKSAVIQIPKIIKNAKRPDLKRAIDAVLAAEATLSSANKFIAISSKSPRYLRDLQDVLRRFSITSSIGNNGIIKIYGIRNFSKIYKEFNPLLKNKIAALQKLQESKVVQSPKGQSKVLYLKSISDLGAATWSQIMERSKRTGNSSRIYLKELLEKDYVEMTEHTRPRRYKVTAKGIKYLEENKIYWT